MLGRTPCYTGDLTDCAALAPENKAPTIQNSEEEWGKRARLADLEHGVAVGIRDVDLQPSKVSVIVVGKVKCLNA